MAVDKLVDSTQLDADLTSVANAIRTKGGTSASLEFPSGFVTAIGNISGGGYTDDQWMTKTVDGPVTCTKTSGLLSLDGFEKITKVTYTALQDMYNYNYWFRNCKALKEVSFPELRRFYGSDNFKNCYALEVICMPKLGVGQGASNANKQIIGGFVNCTKLKAADFKQSNSVAANAFNGSTIFDTLIIRGGTATTSVPALSNINAFTNTPFASNGSGGTLYVPASMISSIQTATNWSTILGYANNNIKSIESTATDPNAPIDLTTHYADGTLISS